MRERIDRYWLRGCFVDNVTADAGAGGATFAADDIGGIHFPRTKMVIGADGVNDGDVSAANPLPVTGTVAVTNGGLTELAAAINASSQMDVNIAASGATVPVSNAGLTELAAAINASSQIDVNIAAQGLGTLTVASHAVTNAGTFAVQVDGAALTAVQKIDDPVLVDDAAFTPATSSVMMAGFEADESATDSVDEGDAGAARMTLDRKAITNPQPHTAGGLSISRDIDLDNSTLTVVKNAPGQLYGWDITNTTTATVFVKFYDATSGTLGTGTPVMTVAIPGNASDDTLSSKSMAYGIIFATGICVGAGTGVADADNTDPGANGVVANIYYK